MQILPETLRDNVRLLGDLLGKTLLKHEGKELFAKVEQIRAIAKTLTPKNANDSQPLIALLEQLDDKDILPITRAFNQFLNLVNIADQQYYSSAETQDNDGLENLLIQFSEKLGAAKLSKIFKDMRIDLVLTAHPTEVMRRTLIRKYESITRTLSDRAREDFLDYEKNELQHTLHRLIEEIWTTDEIRSERPSAVDEAKWGFAVIENSLWQTVPNIVRHFDRLSQLHLDKSLPLNFQPFGFFSWMGGDRDGNPNVTSAVTEEVILLGRWMAAYLYLDDLDTLGGALSMQDASEELMDCLAKESKTPYRDLLQNLKARLKSTRAWARSRLKNINTPEPQDIVRNKQDILEPLLLCHRSLVDTGYNLVADGPLKDTIRRVYAFGINLVPLDIRQDGDRHVQVLDELCQHLDMGSYREWDETTRQTFILEQLKSKRPLLPTNWPMTDETTEVIATCKVIAKQPQETLSNYVISMAKQPSDVLAVALILKECGLSWDMPIVPLFETLDDLDRAPSVMNQLWQTHWYQEYCHGIQTVMIGYSDSAKDAGKFAATWAQYKSQEQLVDIAEQHGIQLNLFHGRGGTVGRGGGPIDKAMASQPPGSIKGTIRVTEQGEMIRYKFGMPRVAFRSLNNYASAVLKATVNPNPAPLPEWRELMENMASASLDAYRGIVHRDDRFVDYFRSLTPEQELGKLALGSRPAKRKPTGGVESLRAIPWVFAWAQVRLNLPGWLGTPQALAHAQQHAPKTLAEMVNSWPFFSSFLDLLEMVVGKADLTICAHYEQQLVNKALHPLGEILRTELATLEQQLREIKNQSTLLEQDPLLKQSLDVRKPYIEPLNYLQSELLKRERKPGAISPELDRALKVTMAGISAGARNTG